MRAYRHLNMNPPDAVIPPLRGPSSDKVYYVKPGCGSCHLAQTILVHSDYVTAFSALPFLCRHDVKVVSMRVDDSQWGMQVILPVQLVRVADSSSSVSSLNSATGECLSKDLARLNSHARSANDYFCQVEDQAFWNKIKLSDQSEINAQQLMRMRAIIESEAEDARQDLKEKLDSLADRSSRSVSHLSMGGTPLPPVRSLSWDLTSRLGCPLQDERLDSVRRSMQNLTRPDATDQDSPVLHAPG